MVVTCNCRLESSRRCCELMYADSAELRAPSAAAAPTASPPQPRTAAAHSAGPPSMQQLFAHGPNASFSNRYPYLDSAPQAAALQPGYLKSSAPLQPPPLSLCAQVRPSAAARGGNARRIRPNWWPDLCRRWINFWLCLQSSAFEMPPHKKAFSPIQRRRNLLV